MAYLASFKQDPDAVLDYDVDWGEWLAEGDSLDDVTVTSDLDVDASVVAGRYVRLWISGGSEGEDYPVTVHVVTEAGREDDRTILIRMRQF
jgi:hypothetical protein